MSTASEAMSGMSYIPSLWASKAADCLTESVLKKIFDDIDDNKSACAHCGRYIPDWETESRSTIRNGFVYYAMQASPDHCDGRLCGQCELDVQWA